MKLTPKYHWHYGYPLGVAIVAEFWWRVEHVSRREGRLALYGYRQRKAWERRGYEAKTGGPA
ncbi:MAG: hypothetical protein H0W36_10440 [Gemmatimonadetes bacterium]|nr:hypothetical protein [Gemmatimonadota bacterium]